MNKAFYTKFVYHYFWYIKMKAEEGLEMMLPILAVVALMQFQSDKNLFYPRGK